MSLRLRDLSHLDPTLVPLPNGTEISTRVDRLLGDRVVPQGAVGRIIANLEHELFEVMIVGVGTVRYARDELMPRKQGQIRYAYKRAIAWESLRDCCVLEAVVGSHAWGLSDEYSDTDLRGAFALPFSWTCGLVEPPLDLVSIDGSATYWETRKLIQQALRNDPNTLELLFVPTVRALDPIGQWLLEARDAFVSVDIYASFGRYAISQLKRMQKSLRLAEHRHIVLEWLNTEPCPTLDDIAHRLALQTKHHSDSLVDAELRAKEYIKQLYRSMFDQGFIASRDFESLALFAREQKHDFDVPRELRPKNAYNLIRLIVTATRWLNEGSPTFQAEAAFREQLLAIKRGEYSLEQVIQAADALTPALEQARHTTTLPTHPDVERIDQLQRRIAEEIAKRWVHREPNMWGKQAHEPPKPTWNS